MNAHIREKLEVKHGRGFTYTFIKEKIKTVHNGPYDPEYITTRFHLGLLLGDVFAHIFMVVNIVMAFYIGNPGYLTVAKFTLIIYLAQLPGYWSADVLDERDDAYRLDSLPCLVFSLAIVLLLISPVGTWLVPGLELIYLLFRYGIGTIIWIGFVILLPMIIEFFIFGWWLTWDIFDKKNI